MVRAGRTFVAVRPALSEKRWIRSPVPAAHLVRVLDSLPRMQSAFHEPVWFRLEIHLCRSLRTPRKPFFANPRMVAHGFRGPRRRTGPLRGRSDPAGGTSKTGIWKRIANPEGPLIGGIDRRNRHETTSPWGEVSYAPIVELGRARRHPHLSRSSELYEGIVPAAPEVEPGRDDALLHRPLPDTIGRSPLRAR